MDLEALEDEFAANSWPKTAEKTELLQKLRLVKTVLLLSFFLDDPVECALHTLQKKTNHAYAKRSAAKIHQEVSEKRCTGEWLSKRWDGKQARK